MSKERGNLFQRSLNFGTTFRRLEKVHRLFKRTGGLSFYCNQIDTLWNVGYTPTCEPLRTLSKSWATTGVPDKPVKLLVFILFKRGCSFIKCKIVSCCCCSYFFYHSCENGTCQFLFRLLANKSFAPLSVRKNYPAVVRNGMLLM